MYINGLGCNTAYYRGPVRVTGETIDRTMRARENHHRHPSAHASTYDTTRQYCTV